MSEYLTSTTHYLQEFNEAAHCGDYPPSMDYLPRDVAARIERFIALADPLAYRRGAQSVPTEGRHGQTGAQLTLDHEGES